MNRSRLGSARRTRRYVWFEGKTWLDTGLRDYRGDCVLVNWTRPSDGMLAPPGAVRPVDLKTAKAITWFRRIRRS